MTKLGRILGSDTDLPVGIRINVPSAAAGSGADTEVIIGSVPDLLHASPSNAKNGANLGSNAMVVREVEFISGGASDTVPSANTDYFEWRVNIYRKAAFYGSVAYLTTGVDTDTGASAVASANTTVSITPTSMTNIVPGSWLQVDTGAAAETIYVLSVNSAGTAFTAFFTKSHSAGVALVSLVPKKAPVSFVPVTGGQVTSSTSVTAGSHAATVTSTRGFRVGDKVSITGGTGTAENVVITALTATTITATFANSHSGTYTITNLTGTPFPVQAGDVLTLQRITTGSIGLASPIGVLQLDWAPAALFR